MYCMCVTMHQATKFESIPTLNSSCCHQMQLSIVQLLDQGIIRSVKRRYKKKLTERYLVSVENNKDANTILKQLDIVAATNMVHNAWKETSSTIIQNYFCKAGFKHHAVDPDPAPEEPPVATAPDVWNKVQRWMGDVQFDDFVASESEAPTTQPMTDEEIINLVHTENDAPQEESDDDYRGCVQNSGGCVERHYYCRFISRQYIGDGFNQI